jgi:hypothetical protein
MSYWPSMQGNLIKEFFKQQEERNAIAFGSERLSEYFVSAFLILHGVWKYICYP